MSTKKDKAALYIRVSTHHQIDKDSLPFQRQELANYCKYILGIDDFEVFEDAGYSAKNTDRPKYQEMMSRIRNNEFSHLLVWKLDRISRNLLDFCDMYEELKKYNIIFVSKNEQFDTSSAMGEAMLKIILIFAELERKLTAERVYSIMLSRAEKGKWNGAPTPLGYDYDEKIEFPTVNKEEAKVVKFIFDEYLRTKSTGEVKHSLDKKGYKTKHNKNWGTKVIGDIIKNPFYIGTYRYNYRYTPHGKIRPESEWIVVEDNHEPIIDKETFEKCNDLLKSNAGLRSPRRIKHIHIFSGLLTCPNCNLAYSSSTDRARKDGYTPSQYRCYTYTHNKREYSTCHNIISDVTLGPFVFRYIFNLMNVIDIIKKNENVKDKKIEKVLLTGEEFSGIAGIVAEDLEEIINIVLNRATSIAGEKKNKDILDQTESEFFKQEKKLLRALERLEDLYLFSDESMSEKDYLLRKQDLDSKLRRLREEFKSEYKEKKKVYSGDLDFIKKSTEYLLLENILSEKVSFRDMVMVVDKNIIKAYVDTIIKEIIADDGKILSIEFTNGMVHRFIYK